MAYLLHTWHMMSKKIGAMCIKPTGVAFILPHMLILSEWAACFPHHSVGWWPRPWQRRRCRRSSRTCRASSDALLASPGPETQSNRKTRWGWSRQYCGGNKKRAGMQTEITKRTTGGIHMKEKRRVRQIRGTRIQSFQTANRKCQQTRKSGKETTQQREERKKDKSSQSVWYERLSAALLWA